MLIQKLNDRKLNLNFFLKWLFPLSLLLLSACSQSPDVRDINGKPISFSQYQGKWVVLNYWAAWCKPCITEIPQLNALYQQHRKKVVVLGINFDQLNNKRQQELAQKYKIAYPLLASNPAEYLGLESISVIPTTYLIDPKGHLKATLSGPQSRKRLERAMGLLS